MIKTYFMDCRQLQQEGNYQKAYSFVSPYRRQKIDLLKHQKDKDRSLAAALALHRALLDYDLEERSMEYDAGQNGKPYLRYYPKLHFSLSHSGDYAICSFGNQEIGNDIEKIKSGRIRVAQRFFAEAEKEWLAKASTEEEKDRRMFRLWTMKESFLKVTGLGMSLALDDFLFTISEEESIQIEQQITDKQYYMKEYVLPTAERNDYCISVCSEENDFSGSLEGIRAAEILNE